MHLCAKHGRAYPLTPSTNRFQRFFNVRTIIAFAYYLDVKLGDINVIKKINLLTIVASYSQR